MGTETNSTDEWIELYNNTDQNINLEGWGLYKIYKAKDKILIEPLTGTIKAKSYYLIERTDDATISDIPASQKPSSWGGYGLKNNGEHLQLLNNNSQIIDEVDCANGWFAGDNKTKKTMERINPSFSGNNPLNWQTSQNPGGTPKAKNSKQNPANNIQETIEKEKKEIKKEPIFPKYYPNGIVFNEILPSPKGPDKENEWIEIFNQNNFKIDISKWKIIDLEGKTKSYTFPEKTIINPQGFLTLFRTKTKITLNNAKDGLILLRSDGKIVDKVVYKNAPLNQSYNRTNTGWVWSNKLTPNSPNIILEKEKLKESNVLLSLNSKPKKNPQSLLATSRKNKGLASINLWSRNTTNKKNIRSFSSLFLIALGIAIFSGLIILTLKNKLN